MSMRLRLILLFGGLAVVLLASEWYLVHSLTDELTSEVGEVSLTVGRQVISGVAATHVMTFSGSAEVLLSDDKQAGTLEVAASDDDGFHESLLHRVLPDMVDPELVADGMPTTPGRKIRIEMLDGEVRSAGSFDCAGGSVEDRTTLIGTDGGVRRQVYTKVVCPEDGDATAAVGMGDMAMRGSIDTLFHLTLDHPADARVLFLSGPDATVHEIPIPRQRIESAIERASNRLLLGSLGILIIGLLVAGLIAHRVSAPLRSLAFAARSVGEGNLGVRALEKGGGEVREAIRSFNRMSSRLEELDAAAAEMRTREHLSEIGEIARGLAHTLRNPLNALGLSVEELAGRAADGNVSDELVASSRRQIRRMDHSIRSFLALASGGAGEVEDVDMLALVQDVVLEVLQDTRQRTPIKIEERDASLPAPSLDGIAPELRAVIQALVVNAVEASPPGSAVRVRLVELLEEQRIRIEVEDAGAGVPVEVRTRLFTPHTTTKATGSGMGLFLAHRIATSRYAGSLEIRDREPRGTVAVLDLGNREVTNRA